MYGTFSKTALVTFMSLKHSELRQCCTMSTLTLFFPPMARQKILEPSAQERALIYNSTYFYPN